MRNYREQDSQGDHQIHQQRQRQGYRYDVVDGKQVGKNWLKDQKNQVDYRKSLFNALSLARDKYVKRVKEQGGIVPQSLSQETRPPKNMKTIYPEIPNYSSQKQVMHKFAGMCIKSRYQRYFTVDNENFKYYKNKDDASMKKSLELKESEAFLEEKAEFMQKQKSSKVESGDMWNDANAEHRVGIKLKGRDMKPIYVYCQNLHDAKFLLVNIKLRGGAQYISMRMKDLIETAYLIEKSAKFKQIVNTLCFCKEKRFVAMYGFQELAINMVEIAHQSEIFRKNLMGKWFSNMLGDDEKPVIRSPFRSANPKKRKDNQSVELDIKMNRYLKKLTTFVKGRKFNRQAIISKEIQRQINEEINGIEVDQLTMDIFDDQTGRQKTVLQIKNSDASLIIDNENTYKFLTIENKSLSGQNKLVGRGGKSKNVVQNLMQKIQIEDISWISTDLDQTTQFDYNNKMNKQSYYHIKIYGRIKSDVRGGDDGQITPSELGYDVLRRSKQQFRISVSQIKFPAELALQEDEKITFQVKIFQMKDKNGPVYEITSKCIKIKDIQDGIVFPQQDQDNDAKTAIFELDQLDQFDPNEQFGIGLVIRMNGKPLPFVAERLLGHEILTSQDQQQLFSYRDQNVDHNAILRDYQGKQFQISFQISQISDREQVVPQEREGKRLLVGKYILFQGKPCFVKKVFKNGMIEFVETISKMERKMKIETKGIELIERQGVNVFNLNQEPTKVKNCEYDWIITMRVSDKRVLNQIQSKIQMRQAHLQLSEQDTITKDGNNTIRGEILISLIETSGLILPKEVNRKQMNKKAKFNPVVDVRLFRSNTSQPVQSYSTEPVPNVREIKWVNSKGEASQQEFTKNLGLVHHSGQEDEQEVLIQKTERNTVVRNPKTQRDQNPFSDTESFFIQIVVKNSVTDEEVGECNVRLDDLIDIELNDLAKEFCVCLSRVNILEKMIDEKAKSKGKDREVIKKDFETFTEYSGIIRFQTLFKPTKDTCLRFQKEDYQDQFKSPKQLLHYEYLMAKSDFDTYKYKIPQVGFNPNMKNLGEDMINLNSLIEQCSDKNPQIKNLLRRLQIQQGELNKEMLARQSISDQKITNDIVRQIDNEIKFQSPFEKLYIILKIQRKERPFTEQVFFNFRNIWDIYKQVVRNHAFDTLTRNEWFSFIEEVQSQYNIDGMNSVINEADQMAIKTPTKAMDNSQFDRSVSVSFIGNVVQQMNEKAKEYQRKSHIALKKAEENGDENLNFSLVLCKEWEKEGNQSFIDLVELIKSGVPVILRPYVWGDLMKAKVIELEEKKNLIKNFQGKYNKNLTCFENFQEISQKYDSVAFRQIDQDIKDYKFPAHYYQDVLDQNSQSLTQELYNNMPQAVGKINRINKMKHDKQLMRKLLRILLVWGKNFKSKGVKYQFSYPSGFLHVVHRFINLMSLEDAFWILIGFIKEYPRLWCLQESSMIGDAKSNFRFELTVFKSILEVYFPQIAQKLYQFGLPVESLIYDSITSLYATYFHSDTLLRIWDQLIFYMNTADQSSKRRGIWLMLAPALLIMEMKKDKILQAQTASEIINAYNDGCGINYNPNKIIQMINGIINDVFVIDKKVEGGVSIIQAPITESGGTGSGGNNSVVYGKGSGLFGGFFGKAKATNVEGSPLMVDEIRRKLMAKQNVVYEHQREKNKIVCNFLFKDLEEEKKQEMKFDDEDPDKSEDDLNDNETGIFNKKEWGKKPNPHCSIDYRSWRESILPNIKKEFQLTEEIEDEHDDLYEFESKDIYGMTSLDIKVVHIYLHNLESWFPEEDTKEFRIQVQYGRLHTNLKFEVKYYNKQEEVVRNDSNLQYFHNFKYSPGYNHVKVKLMKRDTDEKVCHCYVNLRGLQRGKFIYLQKTMNAKEYTQNAQSEFPLTQCKLSMFLESKSNKSDEVQSNTVDQEQKKMVYLYSLRKNEPGFINIYHSQKEQNFQTMLYPFLMESVQNDYQNFKQYLQQEVVMDILNFKYKHLTILPALKFGNLNDDHFREFVKEVLPHHTYGMKRDDYKTIFDALAKQYDPSKDKMKDELWQLKTIHASLDTEKINELNTAGGLKLKIEDDKMFSLRSFVFNVLLQSPITVMEKLDVLYDITDITNRFVDGIDINGAHNIYETILRNQLYFIPTNELRTQVENVFNGGLITGIVGAYWTKKISSEIKFDISKSPEKGYVKLEDFLNSSDGQIRTQIQSQKFSLIDVTKEIMQSFVMYQNLFGSKVIDFNSDTSPFKSFNNLFASTGKSDLGQLLLNKTKAIDEKVRKNFRLCLVSVIDGGERVTTELKYNLDDGSLVSDDEKLPEESKKFKKFFMRNINFLNLQGNQSAITKEQFMEGSKRIPLVYDLLRAETFWQDRKANQSDTVASLKFKEKFKPDVNLFLSDREKIFIFKFENRVMQNRKEHTEITELAKNIYLFHIEALFLEDIILDMRDRIVLELVKAKKRSMDISDSFISDIMGKMDFYVRKIQKKWVWKEINDFDRIEKFSDDEVHDNEVIFKLAKKNGSTEEDLDLRDKNTAEGYDCFSIYKHQDNSYEWRLCKIVGKELIHHSNKSMAIKAVMGLGGHTYDHDADQKMRELGNSRNTVHESEDFDYYLEFLHLKEYGKEMWCKRKRQDIIFSGRYSRDQQSFEKNCYKFIMDTYKQ